jgi:hypothetical protein
MQVGKGIRKFEEATDPTRPLSKVRISERMGADQHRFVLIS